MKKKVFPPLPSPKSHTSNSLPDTCFHEWKIPSIRKTHRIQCINTYIKERKKKPQNPIHISHPFRWKILKFPSQLVIVFTPDYSIRGIPIARAPLFIIMRTQYPELRNSQLVFQSNCATRIKFNTWNIIHKELCDLGQERIIFQSISCSTKHSILIHVCPSIPINFSSKQKNSNRHLIPRTVIWPLLLIR